MPPLAATCGYCSRSKTCGLATAFDTLYVLFRHCEVISIMSFISAAEELWLREMKLPVLSQPSGKWKSWDSCSLLFVQLQVPSYRYDALHSPSDILRMQWL